VDLNALRDAIAGKLAAGGVPVVTDPRDVTPPCIVVGLPRVIARLTGCVYDITVPVNIVAGPPGNGDAVAWMLEQVPGVLDALGAEAAAPGTFNVAGDELPAYLITIDTTD
jgi:hypothetical protein